MTALSPNGRLNAAEKEAPAPTFAILLRNTASGMNGTSCCAFGAATSSGEPSEGGLHTIGPLLSGAIDCIGSQETCGNAKVATAAPLSARVMPERATRGAGVPGTEPAGGSSGRGPPWPATSLAKFGVNATPNRSTRVDRSSSAAFTRGTATTAADAGAEKGAPAAAPTAPSPDGDGNNVNASGSVAAPPSQVVTARSVPMPMAAASRRTTDRSKLAA